MFIFSVVRSVEVNMLAVAILICAGFPFGRSHNYVPKNVPLGAE